MADPRDKTKVILDSDVETDKIFFIGSGTMNLSNAAPSGFSGVAPPFDYTSPTPTGGRYPYFVGIFRQVGSTAWRPMSSTNGAAEAGGGFSLYCSFNTGNGQISVEGFVYPSFPDAAVRNIEFKVIVFDSNYNNGVVTVNSPTSTDIQWSSMLDYQKVVAKGSFDITVDTTSKTIIIPHGQGARVTFRAYFITTYAFGGGEPVRIIQDPGDVYVDAHVDNNNVTFFTDGEIISKLGVPSRTGKVEYRIYDNG